MSKLLERPDIQAGPHPSQGISVLFASVAFGCLPEALAGRLAPNPMAWSGPDLANVWIKQPYQMFRRQSASALRSALRARVRAPASKLDHNYRDVTAWRIAEVTYRHTPYP